MTEKSTQPQVSNRITPVVVVNGLAFVSGQLPRQNGELMFPGKVGAEVDMEQAKKAAEFCAKNFIRVLLENVDRSQIVRMVKMTGFVASADDFNTQASVIDAASDVILAEFGAKQGAHARSAIGVAQLPHNAAVEIEMIVQVKAS